MGGIKHGLDGGYVRVSHFSRLDGVLVLGVLGTWRVVGGVWWACGGPSFQWSSVGWRGCGAGERRVWGPSRAAVEAGAWLAGRLAGCVSLAVQCAGALFAELRSGGRRGLQDGCCSCVLSAVWYHFVRLLPALVRS